MSEKVAGDVNGMATAWLAVHKTLCEVEPDWIDRPGTGAQEACAVIRELAASAAHVREQDARIAELEERERVLLESVKFHKVMDEAMLQIREKVLEQIAVDGKSCHGFGVNERGQAECYWPTCECKRNTADDGSKLRAIHDRWLRRSRQRLHLSPLSRDDVKTIVLFSRMIETKFRFGMFFGCRSRKAENAAVKDRNESVAAFIAEHGKRIEHMLQLLHSASIAAGKEDKALAHYRSGSHE